MSNLITCVLPTYNGEKYLKEAIESVLAQTYANFELIIVNDASTDSTKSIALEFVKKDSRVRLINNEVNKKLPASLNVGFANAKGEFYTWISDDNVYRKNAFEEMLNFLLKNENLQLVYCDFEIQTVRNEKFVKSINVKVPDTLESFVQSSSVACFLYRASAVSKIGIYDEGLFLAEDYDYFLRFGLLNDNIAQGKAALHKNLFVYKNHEANLTNTKQKEARKIGFQVLKKNLPLYLARYPDLEKSLNFKTILGVNDNMNEEKLKNLVQKARVNLSLKQIYKALKEHYIFTQNKIYLRQIRKLSPFYALRALWHKKKWLKEMQKLHTGGGHYDTRLDEKGWSEHYNLSLKDQAIKELQNDEVSAWSKELCKLIPKHSKTLEIGCGSAVSSLYLALKNECEISVLDYQQGSLELANALAKELNVKINSYCLDALKPLPFKEKEFDVIFHAGLMEHFEKEQRIAMLSSWRKYCKMMISIVPNASALAYRVGKSQQEKQGTWTYGLELPIHSQIDELIAAGYSFEREYSIDVASALSFLPKRHFLKIALQKWFENNECNDLCNQGYLLVSVGKNE